ncbi:MAG TPA: hypothetical protein VK444_00520 [Methanobacteriaceae archaeon]|nr:hypothetical protein [Methanobacteriaceae archaeon]
MATYCYENYPYWIVILSNLVSLSAYFIGAYIISGLGLIYTILYLLYCLFLEIRLLKNGCVNCYYYGKVCGFGKGRLSALFFKKGDPSRFSQKKLSWKDMIPDMLVFIFPVVGGIILLAYNFSWIILFLILIMLILSIAGNAVVRGLLTCGKCKQRELGCPAEELFHEK